MADELNLDELEALFDGEEIFDDEGVEESTDTDAFLFDPDDVVEEITEETAEREPIFDSFEAKAGIFKKYSGQRPLLSSLFTPAALPKK